MNMVAAADSKMQPYSGRAAGNYRYSLYRLERHISVLSGVAEEVASPAGNADGEQKQRRAKSEATHHSPPALAALLSGWTARAFLMFSSISPLPMSPAEESIIFPLRSMKNVVGRPRTPPYASPTASLPCRIT